MRCKRMVACVFAALLCGQMAAYADDMTVRVDARDIARLRVHTTLRIPVAPGANTLVFPQWIPGTHGPTGPLDSMIGLVIAANGQPLAWRRDPVNMYAIHLEVPKDCSHLDVALESGLPVRHGPGSENLAVINWNAYVMLPAGRDAEQIPVRAYLAIPPDWTQASALEAQLGADGAFAYAPASLARLIDSPVQASLHQRIVDLEVPSSPARPTKYRMAIAADSEADLKIPEAFAADYGRLVAETTALTGSTPYRHYTWLLTLTDQFDHFSGLEHHESSDNRGEEAALTDDKHRKWLPQLLAHEYFHSWNGKYRRPAGLLSPDYQQPMDGSLLWVYEGMTTFWGDVLPVRAGLLGADDFRDQLAFLAAIYDNEPGAGWRPLADTAVAAQVLYDSATSWRSSRRWVDFYNGSVFLWLDLDAELRRRSGARASLDDFVRAFAGADGVTPSVSPYREADIYALLASIAPGDWKGLIHRHLDAAGTGPLLQTLAHVGWRLEYTDAPNPAFDAHSELRKLTDRSFSIGLKLDKDAVVEDTIEGRAAARAGVVPGMKLIAVNGRRFSAKVLDAAIARARDTHQPIELLFEHADVFRTLTVPYFDGARNPHLVPIAGADDLLGAVLRPRSRTAVVARAVPGRSNDPPRPLP